MVMNDDGSRTAVLDCGDNSCLFATERRGMRTNGGCRCLKDFVPPKLASRIGVTWQHQRRLLRDAQTNLALLRNENLQASQSVAELEAENALLRRDIAELRAIVAKSDAARDP